MSFNTNLSTDLDKVRFYAGDTDTTAEQVADATITALLVTEPNVLLCAALVCDHLAAKYSAETSFTNGALSISDAAARVDNFRKKAAELRVRARSESGTSAHVVVGGSTASQIDRLGDNTDGIPLRVSSGQFFNRRAYRRGGTARGVD